MSIHSAIHWTGHQKLRSGQTPAVIINKVTVIDQNSSLLGKQGLDLDLMPNYSNQLSQGN